MKTDAKIDMLHKFGAFAARSSAASSDDGDMDSSGYLEDSVEILGNGLRDVSLSQHRGA